MFEREAMSSGGNNFDLEPERPVFKSPVYLLLSSFEALGKLHKHLNLSLFMFKIG